LPANKYSLPVRWVFFTALTFIAGLVAVYPSPFFSLFALAMPLPLILLVLDADVRSGFLALLTAGVLVAVFSSPVAAFSVTAHYGVLGVVFGLLFKNHVAPGRSILFGAVSAVFFSSLSLALLYGMTGHNPLALGEEGRKLAAEWVNFQFSSGLSPGGLDLETARRYVHIFEFFIPGQLFVSMVASAVLTCFLALPLLRRLNYVVVPAPIFSTLSYPWYTVWILIGGLSLTLLGDHFLLDRAAWLGKNILFVLIYVYFFLGLSVAAYYYHRVKLARPVKLVLIFLAILYIPFSAALLIALGVIDSLANIRRLPEKDKP